MAEPGIGRLPARCKRLAGHMHGLMIQLFNKSRKRLQPGRARQGLTDLGNKRLEIVWLTDEVCPTMLAFLWGRRFRLPSATESRNPRHELSTPNVRISVFHKADRSLNYCCQLDLLTTALTTRALRQAFPRSHLGVPSVL